jgi:acetyl coenzyme A synthetase (ADP forming)-like protein
MVKNFFNPKSIAVIGASEKKNKLGYALLKNLIDFKYGGKIYPINPKYQEILKLKTFPNILNVVEKIDLAIFIIPAKIVPLVLKQCGQKKIKSVIIISAGFREIKKEGEELENEIIAIAKKYGIKILGPNCLGILDSINNLNASFARQMFKKGKIGFISQSGAICCAALDWAEKMNIGFSRFVSLGNMAGLNEIDFLKFFKKDSKTKTIIAYLEQITDGKKFIKETSQITKIKPLIVIKSGETKEGQRAVLSHTGALAKSNKTAKFAFQQNGIIQANSLLELFDLIKFYSGRRRHSEMPLSLKGPKIAILTNAGGPGAISADAVEKNNLEIAKFEKNTLNLLEKKLPASASVKNPIDIIGDAKADRYKIALNVLIKDKKTDAIIIILTPQSVTEIQKTAKTIIKLSKKTKKPILTSFIGGKNIEQANKILSKANIPVYNYPEQAVKVLAKVWNYEKWKKENKKSNLGFHFKISKNSFKEIEKIIQKAKKENLKQLNVFDAEKILKIYQIPIVKSYLAKNSNEAMKISLGLRSHFGEGSQKINQPVILKISSPDIIHKTDAGGIKNNLKTPQEVKLAFSEIMKNVKKKFPKARINGIIIQPMVQEKKEMILGIKHDELFGPFIMFGSGGIFAEVFKDISFHLSPLAKTEARQIIEETKAMKILKGIRGQKPANVGAIVKILLGLSALSQDFPEIKEVDINPLMAGEKKAVAVDARMMI